MNYYQMEAEEITRRLCTTADGLSEEEAKKRKEKYGANEIKEAKKKGVVRVFLEQFADLLVIILIISALISVLTGNTESAVVIVCVITMNAVLGTVQHFKAEKSLAALQAMSSPTAKVIRNKSVHVIKASEITIGDIVLIEQGDIVPADGRIISCASLMVNESSLTGESGAAEKTSEKLIGEDIPLADRKNMVYSGSLVVAGRATYIVTAIAMESELGKVAGLIDSAKRKKTPLQLSLDRFSKQLSILLHFLILIVMILYIITAKTVIDSLIFAVALAVAAIPE
ncbi:MAG: HAD-IC family P-type ATPase, partial [Ruminiclostridium sp.]|nr:HAD-IC family P-type ATPase [Ruminiclostridium sp.]